MQNKHDMKKPLKAIEPVNVDLIKKGDNHYYSENKQDKGLKVDVVENKEGRVPDLTPKNYISNDNFERQSRALFNDILKAFGSEYELTKGMPTKYEVGSNGDILNAISKLLKKKTPLNISSINNWQQSQSIEGIVGFVLEWLSNDLSIDGLHKAVLLSMKSDIIKELINGK